MKKLNEIGHSGDTPRLRGKEPPAGFEPVLHIAEWHTDDAAFDSRLQCRLERLEYDLRNRVGTLWLSNGDCTDMSGAIAVFEHIDPQVMAIVTYSGRAKDTAYYRDGNGGWRAVRVPPQARVIPDAQPR